MKTWRVKRLVDDKWELVGVYNENFVEQLAAAVAALTEQGYKIYETIRVEEVRKDSADG